MWENIVVDEAKEWLGTPYDAKQCLKGEGVDCGTLLHHCYSLVFPLRPMPKDYAVDWANHNGEELYLEFIRPYVDKVDRPIYGGLGTWHFGRAWAHGGIVTEKGSIIHAYGRTGFGVVKESRPSFFRRGGKPREVRWWYPKEEYR